MFDLQELPNDVQALIWEYAFDIAYEQKKTFRRLDKERDNCGRLMIRIAETADNFCSYMRRVKLYETGRLKSQPWPLYKPEYRRCNTCGCNSIHVNEPKWKTKCYECYRSRHGILGASRCF